MPRYWTAVIGGAITTAVCTALLFVLPLIFPFDPFRRALYDLVGIWLYKEPFSQLRIFGGIPGGLVGGYLARGVGHDHLDVRLKAGVSASLAGLALIYGLYVGYNVYKAVVVDGLFPPPIQIIITVPLLFALPLVPAFLLEGLVGGYVGNELHQ